MVLTQTSLTNKQVIECDKCQKKFQSVKQLKRHLSIHKTQDQTATAGGTVIKGNLLLIKSCFDDEKIVTPASHFDGFL